MDWEPAKNMPKTLPTGPWQTQWRDREFMWAQGRPLGHPGKAREAHPAAKGRQRGAKGLHGTTKTGQRWAKGSKNGPSRAPKRHQNGSKMDLAMVKTQNVKTSKKHWFFPSKWIGNQPRTCQKRSQRVPGRPSGGTESTNGRPDDRSGHGQGPSGRSGGRPGPRAGSWPRPGTTSDGSGTGQGLGERVLQLSNPVCAKAWNEFIGIDK